MARYVLPPYYPAPRRGVVVATLETKGITDQLRKLGKEATESKAVIRDVHTQMAATLQAYMLTELQRGIKDPGGRHGNPPRSQEGRSGKDAHGVGTLARSILSPRNRQVLLSGWSVGRLDRTRAATYWRVQEYGYAGFKGKVIPGLFMTGGQLRSPVENVSEHTDARFLQFGQRRGKDGRFGQQRRGGVLIRNPIRGYHFQNAGWQKFEDTFGGRGYVTEFYEPYFESAGLDFLAHMLAGTGRRFTAGRIHTQGPAYSLDEE